MTFFRMLCALVVASILASPSALAQDAGKDSNDATRDALEVGSRTNDEEAHRQFRLGQAHYENGDFVTAAEHFERSYEASRRPQLLMNIYLAYRDAQMITEAVTALEAYLEHAPDIPNRAFFERRLASMREALERPSPDVEDPAPSVRASEREAADEEEHGETPSQSDSDLGVAKPPSAKRSRRSPVPFALMGGGGAILVASAITGGMALSARSEINDESCPDGLCPASLRSQADRADALGITTDALLATGVVVAALGLVLVFVLDDEDDTKAAFRCGPTGCVAGVEGRF
jgi:tetratricopeptide (TPR) repeat protein